MKIRLDQLILKKGITETREKARALIIEGKVLVNGNKVEKPGSMVDENSEVTHLWRNPSLCKQRRTKT